MKLNFIQNLSDEVVRQNHELKTRLHEIKQQLNDFQNQMVELIMSIADRKPIGLTPSQVLQEFVKVINTELNNHRTLKMHASKLKKQCEQSQKEQIRYQRIISQKTIQFDTLSKLYQQEINKNMKKEQQRKQEIQILQAENRKLTGEMQEMKLEKLKMEEHKRREIQDIRHYHSNQFISFREKNEKDHLKKEKQLNRQLNQRQKTIKEMTKAISQLSTTKALENPAAAAEIFKTFNNFQQLAKINKQVKQQNDQLRKQVTQLYRKIILIQSQLQSLKSIEYNLQSQLQRIMIQKQEIQNRLLQKTNQIHKSQKDKEVMERYYDQKWNSEYKKVKVKLDKTFNLKVTELEESYKLRLINIQIELKNALQQHVNLRRRNQELERRHFHDNKRIQELKLSGSLLNMALQQSKSQIRQADSMFIQQFLIWKTIFAQKNNALLQIIKKKQNLIVQASRKLSQCELQNKLKIQSLQQSHKIDLLHQQQQFLSQKNLSRQQFNHQLSTLRLQISSKIDFSNSIRKVTQQQYQSKINIIENNHATDIRIKQKQFIQNNNRWIDKHHQLQSLLVINRKKYDEEIGRAKQEIKQFIENQYKLYRELEVMREKIEKEEILIIQMNNQIQKRELQIVQRERSNFLLHEQITKCKKEIEALFNNRNQWGNQLIQLQRQYYNEFNELRKINEKQVSIYKAKINELQGLTRRNIVHKKQWDKINQMRKQRQSISSQIHIKQAENIILHQIKDYYKTKLKQSQGQLGTSEFKTPHAILARKLKKNRIQSNEAATSHRIFQPKSQFVQKARYAISSVGKNYHLSLSKSRFKDSSSKKMHLQTVSSLK